MENGRKLRSANYLIIKYDLEVAKKIQEAKLRTIRLSLVGKERKEGEKVILVEENEFSKHFLEKYLPQAKIIERRKQMMNVQFYSGDKESFDLINKLGGIRLTERLQKNKYWAEKFKGRETWLLEEEKMPIFARGQELKYFFPVIDNKINIEQKITQLMRAEEWMLKKTIRVHSRFFSLIGSEHEKSQEGNKETTMYGVLDQTKLSQLLNDEKKLKELIQKSVVHEVARGIAGVLDLWLGIEFSKKYNYEKGHIIRKKKQKIQLLKNEDILKWIRELISLHKLESLILVASTDLFYLIEKEREKYREITNLKSITECPPIKGFHLVLTEKKNLFMSYAIVDSFCQKNWKDMGENKLFTLTHFSYKVGMSRSDKSFAIAEKEEKEY